MTNIVKMSDSERKKLFAYAKVNDVRNGGVFDARGSESMGAINVWSRPWVSDEDCRLSECLATIQLRNDYIEIEGSLIESLVRLSLRASNCKFPTCDLTLAALVVL